MISEDFFSGKVYDLYNFIKSDSVNQDTDVIINDLTLKVKDMVLDGIAVNSQYQEFKNFQTKKMFDEISNSVEVIEKAKSIWFEVDKSGDEFGEPEMAKVCIHLSDFLRDKYQVEIDELKMSPHIKLVLVHALMSVDWIKICKDLVEKRLFQDKK